MNILVGLSSMVAALMSETVIDGGAEATLIVLGGAAAAKVYRSVTSWRSSARQAALYDRYRDARAAATG